MSQAPLLKKFIPEPFRTSSASATRLTHLIPDELAEKVPEHVLFAYARTPNPEDGVVDVSCKIFANAINRCAWWLRDTLGAPKNFDTVGYMGSNDIRYFILMFAAIKVGYKMCFTSPRNSLSGHLNVLKGADCNVFLSAAETDVGNILNGRPMRSVIAPELEALLSADLVEKYPYTKSFEEARMDPCLVLHTTGSTGLPKPIVWKNGILSTYEAWRTIPHVDGYVPTTEVYQEASRAYTSMPLFHTSGLNAGITWAMCLGVTLVYGAPHVVPNATYTDKMHQYANVDASMGAPSIYEDLSRYPESYERIKNMFYIVASGAPLDFDCGHIISEHTRIIANLGATETACLMRLAPSIEDWPYFYWHPTHSGIEMRHVEEDMYELIIVRDPKLKLFQGVFTTFPEIDEWPMNDIYTRHPDPAKPFLWMHVGRKDDVIVLSNGEKIAPALMEKTIMGDSRVDLAMVVGKGQFQPAVLIELKDGPPEDPKERHRLLEELTPVIKASNKHAPAHGKLDSQHVVFAAKDKPIIRLGQGKIQRGGTTRMYEREIAEVYKAADDATNDYGVANLTRLDVTSEETVAEWLEDLLKEIADLHGLDRDQDLFEAGVDSLQVIGIARELKFQAHKLGAEKAIIEQLVPPAIYSNSNINLLTAFLLNTIGTDSSKGSPSQTDPSEYWHGLLKEYTGTLPRRNELAKLPSSENMTILLTGSTGSLGSYILDTLYKDKNVAHIICFNRCPDGAERHAKSGPGRGLSPLDPERVEFFQADMSEKEFGLHPAVYERLLREVTHVIHNQWPVNFNWSLASFDPFVRGVRNFISFSVASNNKAFLLFVSSVSTMGKWKPPGDVPEKPIHDYAVANYMGYSQSKLLSECLLDSAYEKSGVRSAVARVGIVAGPVEKEQGMWNSSDYVPSIIVSSAHLGVFPANFTSRDRIDWLPVDKLSQVISEMLVSASKPEAENDHKGTILYNTINPTTTEWAKLVPAILASYPKDLNVKAVPFDDWVEALSKSDEGNVDVTKNPAIKLLDFYKTATTRSSEGPAWDLTKAKKSSETLRSMGAVSSDWISNWMQQWGFQRAINGA